jgi:hypothetical protein
MLTATQKSKRSSSQWKLEAYSNPPVVSVLIQMKKVPTFTPYHFVAHFRIIFQHMLTSV